MSAVTANTSPISFLHSVQEILVNLIQRPAHATDPFKALRTLPDHVLLDIGVDPRKVACSSVLQISTFDTVSGRRLSTVTRTTAKP